MEINNILDKLGIENLSPMQEAVGKAVLEGNSDVVVLSPTGTGKTLAYLLPLLQMVDLESDDVQAIVIVPGRELAIQSAEVMKKSGCGLRCCSCYGGRMTMEEHRMLRKIKPQVIFATPGRLNDHIDKLNINSAHVRYVVIDEFDKCLEMGFAYEMDAIMSKLVNVNQRILLSATDTDSIPRFVKKGHTIKLNYLFNSGSMSNRVMMYKVISPEKDKLNTLTSLLRTLGTDSTMVFVNYRESVERIAEYLRGLGCVVSAYHGGLDQKQRESSLYLFANGSNNIMISTDLASRGLDIPYVDNIIHYHLPENEDAYIHRVGRTARWNAKGQSFFILGPEEELPENIVDGLQEYLIPAVLKPIQTPLKVTLYIGKGKLHKISKSDIVGFLCKKAELKSSEIGRIDIKDRYSYAAIDARKLQQVLNKACGEKIKGVKTIVEVFKS